MHKLELNFYGVYVSIDGPEETINKLTKDFDFFIAKNDSKITKKYTFTLKKDKPHYSILEGLVSSKQSFNSITYDSPPLKYNDYYGKALSIYDYKKEHGEVISESPDLLHELGFLIILSRVGKFLDLQGIHKIHAMGVSLSKTALIVTMPMKGGKSTLFLNMLKNDSNVSIISDDSPIVDGNGDIFPFPLRVGTVDKEMFPPNSNEQVYEIDRAMYGKKYLIPITSFSNKVETQFEKVLLCDAVRTHRPHCRIVKCSKIKSFKSLLKHMVIGVGLPIILEYFVEFNIRDWIKNFVILILRIKSALLLVLKAHTYKVYLGYDKKNNQDTLYKFLNENAREV